MQELVKLSSKELKELQKKNLEITKYFVEFCNQNELTVYLYAGALLGAVRHHGFIPWDDDIDIMMSAPDYKKLQKIWNKRANTKKYSFCYQSKNYNDHRLASSIQDNETTFITTASVNVDCNQGVGIDLDPFHAVAKTKIGRVIQLICAIGCQLFKAGRLPNRQSKAVYFFSKLLLTIFRSEKIRYLIWSSLEKVATIPDENYDKAEYVMEFSMFPYILWKFPKKWFERSINVHFEDTEMPIPIGAKSYLKKRYGDYMKYPKIEDRHPEHKIIFIDLNTPYKQYRGKKYLKNKNEKER